MAFDPHYASVSLLLHGDGADGSTTVTDSSATPKTVTVVGNARISTAQSKFGGSSMYFDGAGDYFTVPPNVSLNLANKNFTVEAWIYVLALTSGRQNILDKDGVSAATYSQYNVSILETGKLYAFLGNGTGVSPSGTAYTGSTTVTTGAWHHVAVVVSGGTCTGYLDGVQQWSAPAGVMYDGGKPLNIGYQALEPNYSFFNGYIDELRITKGVARYTSNFTVPSEAFPNSAEPSTVSAYAAAHTPLGAPVVQAVFGNNFYAYAAAPSPLGPPQVLAKWLQSACIAAPGPLGAPSVMAAALVAAYGSAPSMLGLGAATVYIPLAARAAAPSPLRAPAALATHDFTKALGDAITRWVMDLETPAGTVRVPISSWQATLQSGSSSYVQCVVPACLDYVDTINAATEFVIYRRADVPGTAMSIEYEMARSVTEQARFDQGPARYTCTLSGYPDAFAEDLSPPVAYDRTLSGVRSVSSGAGLRVRCAVDWLLRPGHRAYVGAVPFVVRFINYYANATDSYMDVGE